MKIMTAQAAAALALIGALAGTPAVAGVGVGSGQDHAAYGNSYGNSGWNYGGDRDRDYRYGGDRYQDGERVTKRTRVWQGRDGRTYCRRKDGTTGLLIGGAVGGLVGHEVAGRGDKTLGVVLGAAGGALLGRAIDRSNSRCR